MNPIIQTQPNTFQKVDSVSFKAVETVEKVYDMSELKQNVSDIDVKIQQLLDDEKVSLQDYTNELRKQTQEKIDALTVERDSIMAIIQEGNNVGVK
mgnify:CR=1 FL=1